MLSYKKESTVFTVLLYQLIAMYDVIKEILELIISIVIAGINGAFSENTRKQNVFNLDIDINPQKSPIKKFSPILFTISILIITTIFLFLLFIKYYKLPTNNCFYIILFIIVILSFTIISFLLFFYIHKPLKEFKLETNDLRLFKHINTTKTEIDSLAVSIKSYIEKIEKESLYAETLSSDITHDIKNPLAVMKLTNELLQQSNDKNQIEIIEKSISEIEEIIYNKNIIGLFNELSNNQMDKSITDITDIIQKIINSLRIKYTEVHIDFNHQANFPILYKIKSDDIYRILINIIDNAASFASHVLISTSHNNNYIIISIEDNGCGIRKEDIPKIFVHSYSNRKNCFQQNHSGIGLSAVKVIIEKYKGKIEVCDSKKLGGAEFTIYLPLTGIGTL